MEKSLRRRTNGIIKDEKRPVFLRKVADEVIAQEGVMAAANYLGVPYALISDYIGRGMKVIKSKKTGETFLISTSQKYMTR